MALWLLRHKPGAPGEMVLFRVIVGTLWVSILLLGRAIWTVDPGTTATVSIDVHREATFQGLVIEEPREYAPAARLDLYGNPVEPAIGDYRTDPHGDLYEWHAPDTEILKLDPAGV